MSSKTNEAAEPTEAEVAAYQRQITSFYKKEIPLLKLQEQYERLTADIEEHKLRALMSMHKVASFHAQMQAAEAEAEAAKKTNKKTDKDVQKG